MKWEHKFIILVALRKMAYNAEDAAFIMGISPRTAYRLSKEAKKRGLL